MSNGVFCFIVCFGSVADQAATPPPDTFCAVYQRQVLTQDELNAILKLPRHLRDRLQYNDLHYLCRCQGWESTECKSTQP
jgi:hypothetical protein